MIQYAKSFFKNQISQVRIGGRRVFVRKIIRAIILIPVTVFAVLFLLIISVLQPFYLVRLGGLISGRLGHLFASIRQRLNCHMKTKNLIW